ncbi:putative aminoadipate reductase [Mycena metata]|uniref:Aminoadipate reductase n=1 Tax=Mycena metata TaxID=1033252 RepID=A0AAD7HYT5_9AGAR|nr:putative aminoadipate reductase [Mycena metata]
MTHIPLDCSLNFADVLDLHIARNNKSTMYSFADEGGRITEISRFEFARAAHRAAHLLRPGRRGLDGQVLAIIALTDVLVYQTIVAGCIKAGLVPFQISHRNSTAALIHLLSTTGSHRLLNTKEPLANVVDTLSVDLSAKRYELSVEEIPLLGQLYPRLGHETAEDHFVAYPSSTVKPALDEVAMYLHSSGSTGFPKPIPESHRNLIQYAALEAPIETVELSPRHAVGALPGFHILGMFMQLLIPVLNGGMACIYPPVSTPTEYNVPAAPTPESALENAKRTNATGITAVPAFLMEWQSPDQIEYLKTLKLLQYSGGPLTSRVGDFLFAQGVNIVSVYGSTECGVVNVLHRRKAEVDAGEWAWFRFSSRVNVRWVSQGDGTHECQLLTVPEAHQLAVENLPDVKGYATKDLFERHPTKPDLYRIVGRLDDVLIMANGEKTVPGPMEDIMMASPLIAGAVMFGRERNQVGVLIDPNPQYTVDPKDEKQIANFRNLIWPVIQEANENTPAFARIYKEMILITQPDRPMVHSPKGTVIKKSTIALYQQDIENLYLMIETSANAGSDIDPPSSWTPSELEPWLKIHAALVAGKDLRGGRDLFDQGFDSLNATFLRHRIANALNNSTQNQVKAAARKILQNFVYEHPTLEELARAISGLVDGNAADGKSGGRKAIIEEMIAKYSEGFDESAVHHEPAVAGVSGTVVLLTGSTGGIGSHILEILLRLPSVERVYAFNRPGRTSVVERQTRTFLDRALDVNLLASEKLVYLEGEIFQAGLGLPSNVWDALRGTVKVIIHNAWTLDFNKSLTSFESHVRGTRNLIDLARQSPRTGVRFLFASSIASAQSWDQTRGPVPEELQPDADVAVGNGYGESKYVSERILALSGLDATSFRIGQVSGSPSNGAWSTTDWVPAIVKSSIVLENFPSDPSGVVAWLPPEAVSQAIVDAALSVEKPPFAINLIHPRPIPWDDVISTMARIVRLPLVPFADWVKQLEDRSVGATAADIENIPGIKLLDFFRAAVEGAGNIQFSTEKTQTMSESMRLLKPLGDEDVQRWMQYWREKQFLP